MQFPPLETAGLVLLASSQPVWFWSVTGVVVAMSAAFWIAALISIARSGFAFGEKALFILGTLAFPLVGPLTWFLFIARRSGQDARRS